MDLAQGCIYLGFNLFNARINRNLEISPYMVIKNTESCLRDHKDKKTNYF